MADHNDADTQILQFQSQTPSSPPSENEEANDTREVGYQNLQNTLPFEDTVVLDSPLAESQLENLDLDTELEGNADCVVENPRVGVLCGHGEEVVLDSEDEGAQRRKVNNSVVDGKAGRRFKGNVLDLEKEQLGSLRKQVGDVVADSDDSDREKRNAGNKVSPMHFKSIHGAKTPSHSPGCDHYFRRLNYVRSQEPGESSQTNALDFVDHFLLVNKVDSSPRVHRIETVIREKSPPVSSAKGPHTLVQRIKHRSPLVKAGTFEWTDSDQHGEVDEPFSKRTEALFVFGGCRQTSVTRHPEARDLQNNRDGSLVNDHKENESPNICKEMMNSPCSESRSAFCSSTEISRTGDVTENNSVKELDDQLDARLIGQQLEANDLERDTSHVFDVGFSTQVAAEAMEALAFGPPAGSSYGDAHQGPENNHDQSPRGINVNKAHSGHSFFQKSSCPDIGDIGKKSTRRKRSARITTRESSSSIHKHSETKVDVELAMTARVKGGKSSAVRQLHCQKSAIENESSGRRCDKPTKHRKVDGSSGTTIFREFEIDMCASISGEPILHGKELPDGKCMDLSSVVHQTRQSMSDSKFIKTKDHLDDRGKTIKDHSMIQYRRKRSHLVADPVEGLSANKKCSKLDPNSSWKAGTRRKRSARITTRESSSSIHKHSETKVDVELAMTARVKGGKSSAVRQLHCQKSAIENESSGRRCDKPTKHRKVDGSFGTTIFREFEIDMCASISGEPILHGKGQPDGKCMDLSSVVHQTSQSMSDSKFIKTKDHFDDQGETIKDHSMIQYRRKRSREVADPFEGLSASKICSKLDPNSSWKAGNSKLNQKGQSISEITVFTSNLRSNPWRYPRGKRTCHYVRRRTNGVDKTYDPCSTVDGKDSSIHSSNSQKMSEDNDKVTGKVGSSVHTLPCWHSSESESDRNGLGQDLDEPGSAGPISKCESAVITTRLFPTPLCRARASMLNGNLDGDSTSFSDVAGKNHEFIALSNKTIEPSGSESNITFISPEGIRVALSNCISHDYHRHPCNKNLPKSSLLKELIRLGVPESIPNLPWKDLRRRRDMAYVRVLFSQHLDNNIIRQQKKILARLGISIASCCRDATHFVTDEFARTRNMLEAIALGKAVVTHLWLESCGQASCLIDEKNYILRDNKKEKEIGFCMPASLARARKHPLLKGQRVLVTPSVKPDKEMITSLVKAAQGQPVERNQISAILDQTVLGDLLIISCEEDNAICRPFLEKGAAVYSPELLLKGIVVQNLEYGRHKLFINQVKRNHSSA